MVKERNIFLINLLLVFAPDTDCSESVFFTAYDTHNGGGQTKGSRASGGFGVKQDWHLSCSCSDHGTVWSLHLEKLDDEGGASCDNLGWQVGEGTVLDAHNGQLAAKGQLEREAVQVGVVIEVQFLQVLQCANLLREVLQQVLPQTKMSQVGEVANTSG